MAYSNNTKKLHHTPVWLPTAQTRVATSTTSSITMDKSTTGRYIYYLQGTTFYRYDTYSDMHQKLASPPTAAVTASSIRYSHEHGYRCNCLNASTNTITVPGLSGNVFEGATIKITAGTGVGQERVISDSQVPYMWESGVATTASANLITDTTKKWEINKWIGYQVRLVFGTGTSQVRKVLYNDANTLYFYDINYQQLETWNNTPFSATAPYALPVTTAGLQANYYIESTVLTVDSSWGSVPDQSSSIKIETGGLFMVSAVATAPWSSFQYYDVASDTWTPKTALGGNLIAALGTDYSLSFMTKESSYESGTASSGTARTLVDTSKTLEVDRFCNYEIRITAGTGIGQINRIVSNGTNYYEIEKPWVTNPDNTSVYEVYGDTNKIWLSGNGQSSLYQYSIEQDAWHGGAAYEYGQTVNASIQYVGQEPYAISTGVYNAAGIQVLNPVPTVKGSGYAVGDLFNITTGGTVGKGRVESISAGGVVETVSLYSAGINYTTGPGKVTTVISGSGNGALTVDITTVGKVGRITTVQNVNLYKGDTVVLKGSTAWNATYTVLAIDSLTTFDIIITPTSNLVVSDSNSATVIVDCTKNWTINEHAGKIVKVDIAGASPTSQFRRITSNTATTLTVATITPASNGTSRYVIMSPEAFGRDRQYSALNETNEGRATSGTSSSLTDSTKTWQVGQWSGYKVRILAGTGVGSEVAISANTSNTLTLTTPGFTPDTTTKYVIMDTFGTATGTFATTTLADSTKNWPVNKWAGKRVRITSGTDQSSEVTIASNTATALTFAALATITDATTTYTILGPQPRSTGTELRWIFGNTHTPDKGKFLISVRGGGANTIDRYDITTDEWNYNMFFTPQSEIFNTGSSYAYDGVDSFYMSLAAASDFIYINKLNVNTLQLEGAFQSTVLQGTVHIGNLMEVVSSPDGGKFIYLVVNTSRLMYKTLIII